MKQAIQLITPRRSTVESSRRAPLGQPPRDLLTIARPSTARLQVHEMPEIVARPSCASTGTWLQRWAGQDDLAQAKRLQADSGTPGQVWRSLSHLNFRPDCGDNGPSDLWQPPLLAETTGDPDQHFFLAGARPQA